MFYKPRRALPRIVTFLATCLLVLVFCTFLVAMVIEWLSGCGETYVDANGVRHRYECVFLTLHNEGVKK